MNLKKVIISIILTYIFIFPFYSLSNELLVSMKPESTNVTIGEPFFMIFSIKNISEAQIYFDLLYEDIFKFTITTPSKKVIKDIRRPS